MQEYLLYVYIDGIEEPFTAKSSQWPSGTNINMEIATKGFWNSSTHTYYPPIRVDMIQWKLVKNS